jgi:hypothetical protein
MSHFRDIAERAGWTALQAFLAVYTVTDVTSTKAALVAAVGAALSVLKGFVATKVNPETGAQLP